MYTELRITKNNDYTRRKMLGICIILVKREILKK